MPRLRDRTADTLSLTSRPAHSPLSMIVTGPRQTCQQTVDMKRKIMTATALWITGMLITGVVSFFWIQASALEDFGYMVPSAGSWEAIKAAISGDAYESALAIAVTIPTGIYLIAIVRIFLGEISQRSRIFC